MKICDIPRQEYPRPQFVRDKWMNLNGTWEFFMDPDNTGMERSLFQTEQFLRENVQDILVPFCPESRLSGIGYTDFIPAVWYRRTVKLQEDCLTGRTLLHFGAVDFHAVVWVNGKRAGEHSGGYEPFALDVTKLLAPGENEVIVYAENNIRSRMQPCGKQTISRESKGTNYTRTTGIWQTVWLEFLPFDYIRSAKITPLVQSEQVLVQLDIQGGGTVTAQVSRNGETVSENSVPVAGGRAVMMLPVPDPVLWDVGQPNLYDLVLTLDTGDCVRSYFGMRSVEVKKDGLYLNGRPLFMRTVLDQGFYPEGIYTAPTDADLKNDIVLSMDLGFNGARFHQKAFEPRSLYWADRLGYLVWGETACNPIRTSPAAFTRIAAELVEIVNRDYNHPCIIGWIPENETYWRKEELNEENQRTLWQITKQLDPYRPVIDASGGVHFETDMFDIHDYNQDPEALRQSLACMIEDPEAYHNPIYCAACLLNRYMGQPFWVSEYGGTYWNPGEPGGWGYGDTPQSEEEFAKRYAGLTAVLLEHPRVCGFCYTQLTDIEQEQNGLYKYDRSRKFSDKVYDRIREANRALAAIEKS